MSRLSQIFAPKEREFFDLFEEAGNNAVRAADLLEQMLEKWPDHGEALRDVVVCEQEGDRITHDIIQRLNQTFVTPFDREDIIALASAMDNIVDFIEEIADFLGLFRIEAPTDQAAADGARAPRGHAAGQRRDAGAAAPGGHPGAAADARSRRAAPDWFAS